MDKISVLFNDGNGTFTAYTNFPTDTGPVAVTAAHIDGDENLDLIVTHEISKKPLVFFSTLVMACLLLERFIQTIW